MLLQKKNQGKKNRQDLILVKVCRCCVSNEVFVIEENQGKKNRQDLYL